jgi:hypothetical protein
MKKCKIYWVFVVLVLISSALFAHQFTLTKVGEWGTGAYNKVFVKGNYAYCAAGYAGLDIINIANPAKPQKVGNYDTPGNASDVFISGNYAYVADSESGLQVIDISSPSSLKLIGTCDTPGSGAGLYVYGNYAYIADGDSGLQIINVSTPASPTQVGNFPTPYWASGVSVVGNYAYVITGEWDVDVDEVFGGLIILDISNPASPQQVGTANLPCATGICVSGNYAYVTAIMASTSPGGFLVIDVTDPSSPVRVASLQDTPGYEDIDIKGNYAYCSGGENQGLDIIDISNPTNPIIVNSDESPGKIRAAHISGNYAYVASHYGGLKVFNVSTPANPVLIGNYDASGDMEQLCISGNYAYAVDTFDNKLKVIDVSTPASPTCVGEYDKAERHIRELFVKGRYAYAACSGKELQVIDISDPTSPSLTGTYESSEGWQWAPRSIFVSGYYAYVADDKGFEIINISVSTTPSLVNYCTAYGAPVDIFVKGKYVYAIFLSELKILDISTPTAPVMAGSIALPKNSKAVFVGANYAYVVSAYYGTTSPSVNSSGRLSIVNIVNPTSPFLAGTMDLPEAASDVYVTGNYAYVTCGLSGLKVIQISKPASPTLAASYDTSGPAKQVNVNYNLIYVANGESGKLLVLQSEMLPTPPRIQLNRTAMDFAATDSGTVAIPQTFFISNTGEEALEWSISDDQQWINCSPSSGTDSSEVTVSVDVSGLSTGTYTGTITVSAPNTDNSPQQIAVTLKVYGSGQTSAPFGQFETPTDNSTVSGSIPVTGWVLDDIGVQNVQIFRESQDSQVYIGDAVFVEGARPDVEQTYPGYPMNYKAGWGYMLLTNFLPGGNGTFTLHAVATDAEGNTTTLGSKTIIVDNAHAVKPFGTLDTPTQGGIVSGRNCPNFGWVLTPKPNTVSIDGSTIHVWVDGLQLGSPVYNQYREDIASFFPDYNNSGGAVGYFNLNTTWFSNGVHTLYWTATDDAGNSEGIGSRYFSVQNTGNQESGVRDQGSGAMEYLGRGGPMCSPISNPCPPVIDRCSPTVDRCSPVIDLYSPVSVCKGYDMNAEPQQVYPDRNGNIRMEIKELERVVIHLKDEQAVEMKDSEYYGYLAVGSQLKSLPIGTTMDAKKGIFYWQPGPGFVGRYRFVFIKKDSHGEIARKNIIVSITPKFL